jgi:hypothetical protein
VRIIGIIFILFEALLTESEIENGGEYRSNILQGCTHFRRMWEIAFKFQAPESWREAFSMLRNDSSGVSCEPHCYLAVCTWKM